MCSCCFCSCNGLISCVFVATIINAILLYFIFLIFLFSVATRNECNCCCFCSLQEFAANEIYFAPNAVAFVIMIYRFFFSFVTVPSSNHIFGIKKKIVTTLTMSWIRYFVFFFLKKSRYFFFFLEKKLDHVLIIFYPDFYVILKE